MTVRRRLVLVLVLALSAACKSRAPSPSLAPPEPVSSAAGSSGRTPCGGLGCMQYDSPLDAFRDALAGDPRVVSIGEAHAPKGATVASSAKRFTESLLPALQGHASDLLLELMNPPTGCGARVAEVKKKQEVVTSHQSKEDQNEYVAMGEAARRMGIVPDLLRPSCADIDGIEDAGDDAIDTSLETIERLTEKKVKELVDRDANTKGVVGKVVVTYGGAIHNDPAPAPDRRAWSFGPAISSYVNGRYVAIDLYVPEFIDGSDAWKKLVWYAYYDPAKLGAKTTLFRLREGSYVILFPRARSVVGE
jgi:hypothetical protein